MIAVGSFRDKENRRVFRWTEPASILETTNTKCTKGSKDTTEKQPKRSS